MAITAVAHHTRTLAALVSDIDRAVRGSDPGRPTVDAVAAALRPALGDPALLRADQQESDPAAYRQHVLHIAEDGHYSVAALVWLPGQSTAIHDHVSWCVVGVHQGAEHETRYARTHDGRLRVTGSAVALAGEADGLLPPGDIHRVRNAGAGITISLHVYGADLGRVGTSIRRRYDDALVI